MLDLMHPPSEFTYEFDAPLPAQDLGRRLLTWPAECSALLAWGRGTSVSKVTPHAQDPAARPGIVNLLVTSYSRQLPPEADLVLEAARSVAVQGWADYLDGHLASGAGCRWIFFFPNGVKPAAPSASAAAGPAL